MNFYYDEEAIRYLKAKDPILAEIIDRIGPIERPIDADLFSARSRRRIFAERASKKSSSAVCRPAKRPISVKQLKKSFPANAIWRR